MLPSKAPEPEEVSIESSYSSYSVDSPANLSLQKEDETVKKEIIDIPEPTIIHRKILIGENRLFEYRGPANQEICDLLDMIETNERNYVSRGLMNKFELFKNYIKTEDEKISNHLIFFKGYLKIRPIHLLTILSWFIIFGVAVYRFENMKDENIIKESSWKVDLSDSFIPLILTFTLYTLMIIHLPNFKLFFLFLLIGQALIPLSIFLYDFNLIFRTSRDIIIDSQKDIILFFCMGSYFYSLALWTLRISLKFKKNGRVTSALFLIIIHTTLIQATAVPLTISILNSRSYDLNTLLTALSGALYAPVILFIILLWVVIHYKFLYFPLSTIEKNLNKIKKLIEKGVYKSQAMKQIKTSATSKYINKKINIFSSLFIGSAFIATEIYIWDSLNKEILKTDVNYIYLSLLGTIFILSPIFIAMGISLVVSPMRNKNKLLIAPFFYACFPMAITIPLQKYFASNYNFPIPFEYGILITVPIASIFWISMVFIGIKKKTFFYIVLTSLCYLFLFPVFFLYPLNIINSFENASGVEYCVYVLASVGAIIGIIILLFVLAKKLWRGYSHYKINRKEKKSVINIFLIAYMNLKSCGFWFNAFFFIISFFVVFYTIINHNNFTSSTEIGTLNGILFIISIIFILMNIAIRRKPQITHRKSSIESLSYQIVQLNERIQMRNTFYKFKLFSFNLTIWLLIILPPCICIPVKFLFSDEIIQTTLLTIGIGVPLATVIFKIILSIKNNNPYYSKFLTSIMVTLCWFLVFLPFLVVVPCVASYLQNHSSEYAEFLRVVISTTALLIMITVTIFSIIMNIILNRLEFEKKLRYVSSKLIFALRMIAVKSDYLVCRKIYEQYLIFNDREHYKTRLLDGNPVNWIPFQDPTGQIKIYTKQIITAEAFKILKNKNKNIKETKTYWQNCMEKCCFDEINEDLPDIDMEKIENAMVFNWQDEKVVIVDDFLHNTFDHKDVEYNENEKINVYDFLKEQEEESENLNAKKYENLRNILKNDDLSIQAKQSREQFKSTKTPYFESKENLEIPTRDLEQIKYGDHSLGLSSSNLIRDDWILHLFSFFAIQTITNSECGIVYNDIFHMLRLCGLIIKENPYDTEFSNNSLLSKTKFDEIYTQTAFLPIPEGFSILDLNGFCYFLLEVANEVLPQYNINESIKILITEMIYPYIMYYFPEMARNYKINIRAILKPQKKDDFDFENLISTFQNKKFNKYNSPIPNNKKKQIYENNNDNDSEHGSIYEEYKNDNLAKLSPALSPRKKMYENNISVRNQNLINIKKEQLKRKTIEQQKNLSERLSMISAMKKNQESLKRRSRCVMCIKCGKYMIKCCKCLRDMIFVFPGWLENKIEDFFTNLGKKLGFRSNNDALLDENKNEALIPLKEAPPWPDIVDVILKTIEQAEKEYEKNLKKEYYLNFNLSNILALFAKFSDLYTFSSYAFKPGVPWSDTSKSVDVSVLEGSGSLYEHYIIVFWISISLSIIFLLISKPAARHAKNGTLGINLLTGQKAVFPHSQFFLSKGINILGASCFLLIMRTFIDTFVCDFNETEYWPIIRDGSIECLSDYHVVYMTVGLFGIIIYYPLATFFFPNLQFQDRALDLKYDPTFMVLVIQGKLIITGLGSLFVSYGGTEFPLMLQLCSTFIVLTLLAILSIKYRPCLVSKMNIWDSCFFLIVAWMNGCALFVVVSKLNTVGIIAICSGCCSIFLFTLILHYKIYGFHCFKKNNKVTNFNQQNKEEDEENKNMEDFTKEEKENKNNEQEKKSKTKKKKIHYHHRSRKNNKLKYVSDPTLYRF